MILVTGGTGFIGSRITRRLLERGERVVCFDVQPAPDRLAAAAHHPGLRLVEGDISRLEDLAAAMSAHGVQRVIHTAAVLSHVCRTEPAVGMRINVTGTTNVFEAARQARAARVVYAGSFVVHGSQSDHGEAAITEDAPISPRSFYAHTKAMNERTADAYFDAFGLDCCCLRVSSPFGPGAPVGGAGGAEVTRLVALAARGQPVEITVAPAEVLPTTYVDDVAEIFVRLCLAPRLTSRVFLCSVYSSSMAQIAAAVSRVLPDARITFGPEQQKVTLPYRIDSSRLTANIGYTLPPIEARLLEHVKRLRAHDAG